MALTPNQEYRMTTLTPAAMRTLHGSQFGRRRGRGEGGQYCGFMIGALFGAAFLFGPVSAAFIYMFTPAVCLLDYEF